MFGKKKKRTQVFTTGPKSVKGAATGPGKKKSAGHAMGGLFGQQPKKTEPDNKPRTMTKDRAARVKRLENKFI